MTKRTPMTDRTSTIDINTLPARPRPLADDAMADVFGGCKEYGGDCMDSSVCCGDMECRFDNPFSLSASCR